MNNIYYKYIFNLWYSILVKRGDIMNTFCNFRCITSTLSDLLSDTHITNMRKQFEQITGINYLQHIIKYENDAEWFILLNGSDNSSRIWLTIFQDPYEPVNRIIINDFSLPDNTQNKIIEKDIINTLFNCLNEIGPISIYSNNSSPFWLKMGFAPDESGIYLTLK